MAATASPPVVTARSQPLLRVRVTVAFQPQEIPAAAFDCQEEEALKGEVAKAQICFLSTKKTPDSFGETPQKSIWTPKASAGVPRTPQESTWSPQAPSPHSQDPQKSLLWPPKSPPDVLKTHQKPVWPPEAPPDACQAPQVSLWPPRAAPDVLRIPSPPPAVPKAPRSPRGLLNLLQMSSRPSEIPLALRLPLSHCPGGLPETPATHLPLPFPAGSQLSTTLRYQAALDPSRAMVRAVFAGSAAAVRNGTLRLGMGQRCETFAIAFTVGVGKGPGGVVRGWPYGPTAPAWGTRSSLCAGQECPRDTLTPLVLRLTYDATGDPIEVAGGLRPALSEDSEMVAVGTVGAGGHPTAVALEGSSGGA